VDIRWIHPTPDGSLPDRAGEQKVWLTGGEHTFRPRLGVYASLEANPNRPFGEQTKMFEDLTEIGYHRGVDVVVLCPGYRSSGQAWRFFRASKRWTLQRVPMPDVVLRRSGTFRAPIEVVNADLKYFERQHRLHSLPRSCSNKWTFYQDMTGDPALRSYFPKTTVASSGREILQFLKGHPDIYVKPLNGAQGVSIYRIVQSGNRITVSRERRLAPRATERKSHLFNAETRIEDREFVNSGDFLQDWQHTKLRRVLVQETVKLPRTRDGRPFDFRWLIQYVKQVKVVARVARVGGPHSITTNIHTGGQAMPAEQVLESAGWERVSETIGKLDSAALAVADRLRLKHGPFAEVGIDLALYPNGDVAVFEANPTPGRRMLRSLPGNVRALSLRFLIEYAIRATGLSDGSEH